MDLMTPSQQPADQHAMTRTSRIAWLVGPAFLAMAAWFLWFAPAAEIPASGTPAFDPAGLAPTIRKTVMEDPPLTRVGAYEYKCNECHRVFRNEAEKTLGLVQHTDIFFNHGMNNRCFNCHDQFDRNKLVGRDGRYISYTQVPLLCSQCHGTTYRDWQRGMHGKTMGSWETGSAEKQRLTCPQCHDPHAPAFPPYEPLPAPDTLRMGDQPSEVHHTRPSPLALPFQRGAGHGESHGASSGPEHGEAGEGGEAPAGDHAEEGGADH